MERYRLIELIKFPESASTKEQEELLKLCRDYPFSAVLKIIRAKIASLNQSPELNKYITSAAITTVDRGNFHHYIRSDDWEVSHLLSGKERLQVPDEELSPPEDSVEIESLQAEKENFIEKIEKEEKIPLEEEISSLQNDGKQKKEHEKSTLGPVESASETTNKEKDKKEEKKDGETEQERKAESADHRIELSGSTESEESADAIEEKHDQTIRKSHSQMEQSVEPSEKGKETPVSKSAETENTGIPDEEVQATKSQLKEPAEITGKEEKTSTTSPLEKKPAGVTEDTQASDKPESKEQEPKDTPGEENEEDGPLASDLLRNIREYRKSRDFFEKILDKNDKTEEKSSLKSQKDQSATMESGEKGSKSPKQKKNKNKKSESVKSKKGEKSEPELKEPEEDPEIKKNTNNPDLKKEIPTEIPDEDTIEKVTEEQKSEGYQVYEEEDPGVIKNFLEKITDESEELHPPKKLKKEEQVEIIEKFIMSEPKIKHIKTPQALRERQDLSATSVKFKDDIISENLATIMKSQGKTEQAIDIYKKLIWKFPQKKAYFASQIEELKKNLGK